MVNGDSNENGKKKKQSMGQISKNKKTCTCSILFRTLLCRCFAQLKRETSLLHVLWTECPMSFCLHFFSLPLISALVAASVSHFLTAAIKFSCFFSN